MTTGKRNPPLLGIMPSVAVGIGMWILYSALAFGIQWSSGIPYPDWFRTADNAWRTAVIPLAAGSLLLLAFAQGTRWRHLWSDPFQLQTTKVMRVAMILWCIAIAVRLVGIKWSEVPHDLLLAIVTSGILVGFAEEILFPRHLPARHARRRTPGSRCRDLDGRVFRSVPPAQHVSGNRVDRDTPGRHGGAQRQHPLCLPPPLRRDLAGDGRPRRMGYLDFPGGRLRRAMAGADFGADATRFLRPGDCRFASIFRKDRQTIVIPGRSGIASRQSAGGGIGLWSGCRYR